MGPGTRSNSKQTSNSKENDAKLNQETRSLRKQPIRTKYVQSKCEGSTIAVRWGVSPKPTFLVLRNAEKINSLLAGVFES